MRLNAAQNISNASSSNDLSEFSWKDENEMIYFSIYFTAFCNQRQY